MREQKLKKQRVRDAQKVLNTYHRKDNGLLPLLFTVTLTSCLLYFVYSVLQWEDGFDTEEVYAVANVPMQVVTDKGYEAQILTANTSLTIYGDEKKVKQLKQRGIIPQVELNLTGKAAGNYEIKPSVKEQLINVNYHFSNPSIEVRVLEAERTPMLVLERSYGAAKEGYYVEWLRAETQATILTTSEQLLEVGYVVAEINEGVVTESGIYDAEVVVLNKRGEILDIPVETKTIPMYVQLSPLSWYQRYLDVQVLKEEIGQLETELQERRTALPSVKDVLQHADMEKEIAFRETRLSLKQKELLDKEEGLSVQKEQEESLKKAQQAKSLQQGGVLVH